METLTLLPFLRRTGRGCATAMLLGASVLAVPLTAGPVAAQADSESTVRFDLPSQPLASAVQQLAQQAGIRVAVRTELVRGLQAPSLQGVMSPREALVQLAGAHGLQVETVAPGTLAIIAAAAPPAAGGEVGSVLLSPVYIQGRGAFGEFTGYSAGASYSATKTATPLRETPQTVNVVGNDELRDRAPTRLSDTLRYTPSVVTDVQQSTSYFDRIRVRGFYSVNNIYLGNMQLTPSGTAGVAQIDPSHLERVEVVKGPASVLYGQNGSGGLINMQLKRPRGERHRGLSFGFGNKNQREIGFDLGDRLTADGTLAWRVTGKVLRADADTSGNGTERYSFAPSLLWTPTERTTVLVYAGWQRDGKGSAGSYLPIYGTLLPADGGRYLPRDLQTGDPDYTFYRRDQHYIGTEIEHRFSDALSWRSNLRYVSAKAEYAPIRLGAYRGIGETTTRTYESSRAATEGLSFDTNLALRFDTGALRHEMLVGFDWRYFDSDNFTASAPVTGRFNLFSPSYGNLTWGTLAARTDNSQTQRQHGLYVQDQISLGNWRFVAGLRKDWSNIVSNNHLTLARTVQEDSAVTGRLGALYLMENGLSLYGSYSTSFEPQGGTDYFGSRFRPTTGKQLELGVKYEPAGVNGSFTASLFELRRDNITTPDPLHNCTLAPAFAGCGSYQVQTGQVRVRGLELEGKFALGNSLNAVLGYTYMDAKVTRDNSGLVGKTPPNTPRHMASGWLTWNFDQGLLDGLTLGGGVRYIGGMWAQDANINKIPDHTLVDLMASFDLGRSNPALDGSVLRINVSNLADSKAIAGCWSANFCDYVPGRRISAMLDVKF